MTSGRPLKRETIVRAALVGGPMYDPLYESIPEFERESGLKVEVVCRLPHPELNAYVKQTFESDDADVDLLSTHTKYAPSQAQWLSPLEDAIPTGDVADLLARPAELSRIDGRLFQIPRNLDVRLLHYRRDLFEDAVARIDFDKISGRSLRVPETWTELADVAAFFARGGRGTRYGFLFPGRDSGLFGTFYEFLVSAGGQLFDEALRPAFASPAGVWAAEQIRELHHVRRATPFDLESWHYDEISASFRRGEAALVSDWPGSYHLYKDRATCDVWDRIGLALLPAGPSGERAAYAGCHSFAIPSSARNRGGGAALLGFLTSFEQQLGEARRGAIPCRASALRAIRADAESDPSEARRWHLLAETERFMIIPPRFAAYPSCEDAIWRSIQQAMLGRSTPEQAVRRAASEVERIVELHVTAR